MKPCLPPPHEPEPPFDWRTLLIGVVVVLILWALIFLPLWSPWP